MDSAINGLARHIVNGLPECWGDQVVDGKLNINLTVDADIVDELIEEVGRLDAPRCRICGCSDCDPCPGDCEWVEDDLCSECVETDRLQDAAKDMLEALEEAQKVTYSLYMLPGVKEVDRKICAAIAKAKGENNV